jgi:hypothetical protein
MPMIVSKFIIGPIARNPFAAHIVATDGADAFIRFVRQKFADIVYVAIMMPGTKGQRQQAQAG